MLHWSICDLDLVLLSSQALLEVCFWVSISVSVPDLPWTHCTCSGWLKHTCLLPTPRKCCDDHGQHPCFWSCLSVSGHLVFSTFIDETAFCLKCLLELLKIWNTHYKLTSPLCWATHQTLLRGSAVSLWPQWPFADFKGRQFKSHSFVRFAKGVWVTGAICHPTQMLE